ncbi:MAG: hypothetical protein J6I97_00385 [Agathobacter sp.]|nr:hypothetical protein [Agathobacter sp.]
MAKEINLFQKKKDNYPTKTTINLYYKEDKSAGISTFTLYVIFIIVILMALSKMFVFDVITDLNKAEKQYNEYQATLDSYMSSLADYEKVNDEYNKYSYSYLTDQEKIQDRMDVLKMLEATIFANSNVQSVSISDDVISVSLTDIDLEKTAVLAKNIESYDIVDNVAVNTASYGGTYTTRMVITLVSEGATEETGGEQ